MTPALTTIQEPITTVTWAGQFYHLPTMPDDKIDWLKNQFDPKDLRNIKWLAPIQAEIDRRKPGPEQIRVMVALQKNSATLVEKFGEVLADDGLLYCDLVTGSGSTASTRFGEGLSLALSGRWEPPKGPGWPFRVDSVTSGFGTLKYEVKCKASKLHNYNSCQCDDYLYRAAGKYRGWCRHVCCVWFITQAQNL